MKLRYRPQWIADGSAYDGTLMPGEGRFEDPSNRPGVEEDGGTGDRNEASDHTAVGPSVCTPGITIIVHCDRLKHRTCQAFTSISRVERSYEPGLLVEYMVN